MDTSTLIVVIVGTLAFFGFAVWMAFHSRGKTTDEQTQAGQTERRSENIAEPRL